MSTVEERVRPRQNIAVQGVGARYSVFSARSTVAVLLAGGRGSRLKQLTDWRAKPSVAFGGKFRIVDFTLSNCINSGIRRIGICTQYKAQSLIRHVQRGWSFLDTRFDEFVEVAAGAAARDRRLVPGHRRRGLPEPRHPAPPGSEARPGAGRRPHLQDGLPRMLEAHVESGAQCTVACIEVPRLEARAFGVMAVDARTD